MLEPATTANLNPPQQGIKYNKKTIVKVVIGFMVVIIGSIFITMGNNTPTPTVEPEATSFKYIAPKVYPQRKVLPDSSKQVSENNISLLREYFEQQALLKIKEEDDARQSMLQFNIPINTTKESAAVNNSVEIPKTREHLLKAGSIIPCVLTAAINSDLPGIVVARVRERVFDSATGKYLLIPQGAILTGSYQNNVNFGQERVQIAFNKLDMPNGNSVTLNDLSGYDLAGNAGLKDRVDNHYNKVAVGVSLSSLLAAAGPEPRDELNYRARVANKASDNISEIANKIAEQYIQQGPTITIRSGTPFNIIVAKDLLLPAVGGVDD